MVPAAAPSRRRPTALPRACTTNGWAGRTTTRDKPGVVHSEILLPDGAPARWLDRATLWNEVEAGEKRKDAQLAREIEIALPRELTPGAGDRAGAGFRARAVRGAGHGGGPQRALGPGGERRGPAARARHADHARSRAGGVRQEGAGLEPQRAAGGLAGTLGRRWPTSGWRSWATTSGSITGRMPRRASAWSRRTRSGRRARGAKPAARMPSGRRSMTRWPGGTARGSSLIRRWRWRR